MNNIDKYFVKLSNNNIETIYINEETNGFGKLYVSNDNYSYSYNGYIKNGLMDQFGLIIYQYNKINPTIIKYEGELLNNEYNGKGKLTFTNGDIFIGNFKQNMKHGSGKLYNSIGNIIIDNQWKDDIICDKIKFIEYYIGTTNIRLEGDLLNSFKVGPWIYYREDNIIDKIDFYKEFDINDENIAEILESSIKTNKSGYIISQKLEIKSEQSNIDLIKFKNYFDAILTSSTTRQYIKYFKNISISTNNSLSDFNYYLQLDEYGKVKIISYSNVNLLNLIIFLSNNKYLIKNNDKMSIYQIINNDLSLYYDGNLDKNNQPNGNGILYSNGNIQYKGIFIHGQLKSGSKYSTTSPQYILYDGTYKNNIPDGIGIYYNQQNVKIYEGMIVRDKYHGNGISYWKTTGLKNWDGEWQFGVKHGNGYLYDENENLICHCQYENDNILNIY